MDMSENDLIQSVVKMQEELVSALAEVSRLTADLASQQQFTKPFFASSEEERDQVMKFLFNLQKSGITNMMAADEFVKKRFGFSTAKSQDFLFEFIDNYSELEAKYTKPVAVVEEVVAKKRKGPKPYSEMTPEELAEAKAKKSKVKPMVEPLTEAVTVAEPMAEPVAEPKQKKTIVKLAKKVDGEIKPKGVLIWNAFMNIVKAEMTVAGSPEPSYNEVVKKAQEQKEADPESYKLFSENWSP